MVYGQIQFDLFEFLFATIEELIVSSLYWGEQPALDQGKPFGFIVISERICALKKVLADWAMYLALPLPQGFLYLKVTLPATCLV